MNTDQRPSPTVERMTLLDFIHRHRQEIDERRRDGGDAHPIYADGFADGMALVVRRLARMLDATETGTGPRS